mgnify:CR=1 FL=1
MTCYLLHAFSYQMLRHLNVNIDSTELTQSHFNMIKDECESVIGIDELANILAFNIGGNKQLKKSASNNNIQLVNTYSNFNSDATWITPPTWVL